MPGGVEKIWEELREGKKSVIRFIILYEKKSQSPK